METDSPPAGVIAVTNGVLIGTGLGLVCYGSGANEHLSWGVGILSTVALTWLFAWVIPRHDDSAREPEDVAEEMEDAA